jgi:hypothetical protein
LNFMHRLPLQLLIVAGFNTAIALLLTLVGYGDLRDNFIFSHCIGFSVLLIVDAGRRLLWHDRPPPTLPMVALVTGAIFGGWLGGTFIATVILGQPWNPGATGARRSRLRPWPASSAPTSSDARAGERIMPFGRSGPTAAGRSSPTSPQHACEPDADPDRPAARDAGHFTRATLTPSRRERSTLEEEFALLRGYLEVQAIRMGTRLKHTLELPAALAGASIPPMLLQPLVENAIRHGVEPKMDGGEVTVRAGAEQGRLVVTVSDTGVGWSSPGSSGTGVGLANVRERLAAAYGGQASMQVADQPGGGASVALRLPIA